MKQWAVVEFEDQHDVANFLSKLASDQQQLAKITASDSTTDSNGYKHIPTKHYWHVFYPLRGE